jgi:hypothetical protein
MYEHMKDASPSFPTEKSQVLINSPHLNPPQIPLLFSIHWMVEAVSSCLHCPRMEKAQGKEGREMSGGQAGQIGMKD